MNIKKRLFALCLSGMLLLMSSIPMMAATDTANLNVEFSDLQMQIVQIVSVDENGNEIISPRQPALPVTDIQFAGGRILANGTVELSIWIQGQGSIFNHFSTLGQSRHVRTEFGSGWAPIRDFFHIFDVGQARPGTFSFTFSVRCLRDGFRVWNNLRVEFTLG